MGITGINVIARLSKSFSKAAACNKATNAISHSAPKDKIIRSLSNAEDTGRIVKNIGDDGINCLNIVYSELTHYSPKIRTQFTDFIRVLEQRNGGSAPPERIQSLFNRILKNPNYQSETELSQYLTDLKALAQKKSPGGEYLLNGQTVFHLADFKSNNIPPDIRRQFRDLIHCAELGLLPPNALRRPGKMPNLFSITDGINPEILKDIEKLKLARSRGLKEIDVFIPEFNSLFKDAAEIDKLKPGDLFSVKRGVNGTPELYLVQNNKRLTKLDIDRETCFNLLPPVKRFFIEQGQSGTCYQLSSYISQLNNPYTRGDLLTRMKQLADGSIVIKMPTDSTSKNMFAGLFDDFDKNGAVLTKMDGYRFNAPNRQQSVTSNPLIKALEHLYGKHRKYMYADEYVRYVKSTGGNVQEAYQNALNNMEKNIYIKNKNGSITVETLENYNQKLINQAKATGGRVQTYASVEDYYKDDGGYTDEIFKFFNNGRYKNGKLLTGGKTDISTLNEIRNLLSTQNSIITMGTRPAKSGIAEATMFPNKDLYSSHGYSIIDYNPSTDVVTYINPWNSAFTYKMKVAELAKYINTLAVCRVA